MKHGVLGALFLVLWFSLAAVAATDVTGPIGGNSGVLPSGALSLTSADSGGVQVFVNASTGSDSNAGTQALPWQTLHKVNNSVFVAGTTVNLQGSFSGGDNGLIITATVAPSGGLTLTSYGAGATITSGNSTACVAITSVPNVTVSNLTCVGGSDTVSTTDGVLIQNSSAVQLSGINVNGMTISAYGGSGINILGNNTTFGYNGISILNNVVHDVTGNGGSNACIIIHSTVGYGTNNIFNNATIQGNLVSNCIGTNGVTGTGNGIFVSQISTATLQFNVAHDFGVGSNTGGGPTGIWTANSDSITIQFNESYNGQTSLADGDGFDLDGGVTNSILQYNYSHNNVGYGILVDCYDDGTVSAWNNNIIRYNITEHNGIEFVVANESSTMNSLQAYNNTFIAKSGGSGLNSTATGTIATSFIKNNLFVLAAIADTVLTFTHPTGMTLDYNSYSGSSKFSYSGSAYTTFAAYLTGSSADAHANQFGAALKGVVGSGGTCFVSGTPAGPQPCPTNYQLVAGSLQIAAGTTIAGTRDYYGNAITSPPNIGAYGGAGVAGYVGPGDVAWGSDSFYSCIRGYSQAYASPGTNKSCNIRRSSDSHTCDVLVAASGTWGNTASCSSGGDNAQTVASFCAATSCFVTEAYDQSGAANHATQGTAANQPTLDLATQVGSFGFGAAGTANNLELDVTGFALSQPFSTTAAVTTSSHLPTSFNGSVFILDSGGNFIQTALENVTGTIKYTFGQGGTKGLVTAAPAPLSLQTVINGASSAVSINGTATTGVTTGTSGSTGTTNTIGNDTFSDGLNAEIGEVGLWPFAFTSAQYNALCHNQSAYYSMALSC